jgi:hypothetical protein
LPGQGATAGGRLLAGTVLGEAGRVFDTPQDGFDFRGPQAEMRGDLCIALASIGELADSPDCRLFCGDLA